MKRIALLLILMAVASSADAGLFRRRAKNTETPNPAAMQAATTMPDQPQAALDIMSANPQDGDRIVRWQDRDIVCPEHPPYGIALDIDTSVPVLSQCMKFAVGSVQHRAYPGLKAKAPITGAPDGEYVTMPPGSREYVVNAYPHYIHGAGPVPPWDEKWVVPGTASPCAVVVTLSKGMAGRFDTIQVHPKNQPLDVWIDALANDDTYDKTVPADAANGRFPYFPCDYGGYDFIRVVRPDGAIADIVLWRGVR